MRVNKMHWNLTFYQAKRSNRNHEEEIGTMISDEDHPVNRKSSFQNPLKQTIHGNKLKFNQAISAKEELQQQKSLFLCLE